VIDVPDRADIAMWLGALEFFFGHGTVSVPAPALILNLNQANFAWTSSAMAFGTSA
jgi:hypothetical protein